MLDLQKTGVVNMAFMAKVTWKFPTKAGNFWVKHRRAKYDSPNAFYYL